MNKAWVFFKTKFLSKQFMVFVIIGVLNTLVDTAIAWLFRDILGVEIVLSGTIAFFGASIFSYFANSGITFKNEKYTWKNLALTMIVFCCRWGIMTLLTLFLLWILKFTSIYSHFEESTIDVAAHFFASALTIPVSYLFLEKILKIKKNNEDDSIDSEN